MPDHPTYKRLQLYLDQQLEDAERRALDFHLAACEECSARMLELRQLLQGLESLAELSLPAEFATDVAEEVAPSPSFTVAPARRSLLIQLTTCLIILLTCAALLLVVDTPVTDPSDDVLGAIDVLLGSPFQADANIVAVLTIIALAGLAALACILTAVPAVRPQRRDTLSSRISRRRR